MKDDVLNGLNGAHANYFLTSKYYTWGIFSLHVYH
jgi:hypothetical protein